ncbi:MAG: acetyl-CoA carboxylase biotin carboxyl carrier protein [Rhodothermales bacterium]|nr:acetyl-CoA carboxylase biotin carboxyl carrier protein [Rhodothermales bacterium]
MDLDHLRELLQLVAASDVAEVEIEEDDLKIVVRKQSPANASPPPPQTFTYAVPPSGYPAGYPASMPPQSPPPAPHAPPQQAPQQQAAPASQGEQQPAGAASETEAAAGKEVRAPIVGTFYQAPSPDADPFVKVGDHVSKGDVLCIIEAMKLMNEIEAEESGTIRKILVEDATPVEYDQALFIVETD